MFARVFGDGGLHPPARPNYGWGQKGHGIVADIAQVRLTEVTKRNVQSLLGTEFGNSTVR